MPVAAPPLPPPVRARLRELLEAHGCAGGQLQVEEWGMTGLQLIGRPGDLHYGPALLLPPPDDALKRQVWAYLDALPAVAALVDIDLAADAYRVWPVTAAEQAQQRQLNPACSRGLYGPKLARQVAAELQKGRVFGHRHFDYCGTGFDYDRGHFRYGLLYDGSLAYPLRFFADEAAFATWLAQQSDATLSRYVPNAGSWDRQTVTCAQLEAFVYA